jgi:hypothetical protein
MTCLALWHKAVEGRHHQKLKIELHINLWELEPSAERQAKHFLDIGIKVHQASLAEGIRLYFPFAVGPADIQDLGSLFASHHNLLPAIFNENLYMTPKAKILRITDTSGVPQFNIYALDIKQDLNFTQKYGGTVVNIPIKTSEEDVPIYFRIRVTSRHLEELHHNYRPRSSWLDNSSTSTNSVDFRINESRNLDQTLLEDMDKDGLVEFKSIDFFVMRDFKYDFISANKDLHRSRWLEPNIWDEYVGKGCKCGETIAYHLKWQEEDLGPEVPGINAFVKFKCTTSNWVIIVRFIFILISIGFLGGLLGSLVFSILHVP